MNTRANKIYRVITGIVILLCLLVLTTPVALELYARYTTADSVFRKARIAAYVFHVREEAQEQEQFLDLSDIQNPGDTKIYSFTVSNDNGSTVSEVAQAYTVSLELSGGLPLLCTITDGNETQTINAAEDALPWSVEMSGSLAPAVEETHTYTVSVEWPEEYNSSRYANGSGLS